MRVGPLFGVALLLLTCVGCAAYPPGPIRTQQLRASLHDPYADPDAAPEVVGQRPRDFVEPRAEPVRSRWLSDSWWLPGF